MSDSEFKMLPESCNEYFITRLTDRGDDVHVGVDISYDNGFGGTSVPESSKAGKFQDMFITHIRTGDFGDILWEEDSVVDEIMVVIEGDANNDVKAELIVNSQSVEERGGKLSTVQKIVYVAIQEAAWEAGISIDKIDTRQIDELTHKNR